MIAITEKDLVSISKDLAIPIDFVKRYWFEAITHSEGHDSKDYHYYECLYCLQKVDHKTQCQSCGAYRNDI